ncbi:MotA/TolQ/ExbB proton channel family protein [Stieleria sp. ICT_E10.1]|uniref:MotA/TolQ/ExbB proton channel family protein n=1 Tax=Stieleria sedimenti TaxID=2976331 RepID=UPI0021802BF0|nr:MotA/TolQ/ExbB proton channel family protein [Stieleria sedimenti]
MTSYPINPKRRERAKQKRTAWICLGVVLCAGWLCGLADSPQAWAQVEPEPPINAADIQAVMNAEIAAEEPSPVAEPTGIDMLSLILRGGRFMIPIGLMSLLVVTLAVERLLSLRRAKVMPRRLVRELRRLADPVESFDPPAAYQACLQHPSPTASIVGAMLMRTGQPLGEIERTATETIGREADRYASPVRWLTLAAAATPLMGLLGTVWGMIVAFHESTSLSADRSRSEQLSEGIYTALVTTLAGLVVAIPAAIFAQYLENRIAKLFHSIEQLVFDLAPGLARFDGRRRLDSDGTLIPIQYVDSPGNAVTPPPPSPPPPPQATASSAGVAESGNQAKAS